MAEYKDMEEAALKYSTMKTDTPNDVEFTNTMEYYAFMAGAQWQKERAKILEEALEQIGVAYGAELYPQDVHVGYLMNKAREALSKYRGEK